MSLQLNGDTGVTFNDTSLQGAAASPYVLKNRIINGGYQVWQRGTSFASTAGYTTDRWSTIGYGSYNETVSQSTSVPTTTGSTFQYSLKLQRPTSSTGVLPVLIGQAIESTNCYDLSSQAVTLSFWAKAGANYSSSGNTLTAQLVTGTTADQGITSYATWAGYATPISNNATLTTSWQKFSYTATLGSGILEAAVIFFFSPSGTAGADDSVFITGVQLEQNTSATPFERRLYNQELANCQRYYQRLGSDFLVPLYNENTTSGRAIIPYPVIMRAAPASLEQSGTASDYNLRTFSSGKNLTSVPSLDRGTTNNITVTCPVSSGVGAAGGAGNLNGNNSNAFLAWSAEL